MDAVEISRVHYESWPSMVLGPYKGFIRGQVTEGSGASAAHGVARPPVVERVTLRTRPWCTRPLTSSGNRPHSRHGCDRNAAGDIGGRKVFSNYASCTRIISFEEAECITLTRVLVYISRTCCGG